MGSCEDSSEKIALPIAWLKPSCIPLEISALSPSLKCLYTNAPSMGNKQEKLEICVQLQGHDLTVITEIWWVSSHDWNAVIDGYVLFSKDSLLRWGGRVALYVRVQCIEQYLGGNDEWMESLLLRIKEWGNIDDIIVGVYYRQPDEEEEVDEAFYKQREVALQSSALLMGDFSHPDMSWLSNRAVHKRSRQFLQCTHDNFLMQVVESWQGGVFYLTLFLLTRKGWLGMWRPGADWDAAIMRWWSSRSCMEESKQ
mgnify:CR=1 FL=1